MTKLGRSSRNKKSGKYMSQFRRTVNKSGKWRGKKADEYDKYVRHRRKNIEVPQKGQINVWFSELLRKYGNGPRLYLLECAIRELLNKIKK